MKKNTVTLLLLLVMALLTNIASAQTTHNVSTWAEILTLVDRFGGLPDPGVPGTAADGDIIVMAPGNYSTGGRRFDNLMKITIRGAGSGNNPAVDTIIDCGANRISVFRNDLVLENMRVQNCVSVDGGALTDSGTDGVPISLTLTNVTFDNCLSTGNSGGGILRGKQELMTFVATNCRFNNIRALTANGGAFNFDGESVNPTDPDKTATFTDCAFTDCWSVSTDDNNDDGGAIYMDRPGSTLNLVRCTFFDITAGDEGGAIYFDDDDGVLNITDCDFTSCTAYGGDGGAFIRDDAGVVTVTNSTFTECRSLEDDGGALMIDDDGGTLVITGSTFTNCWSRDDGGAVRIDNNGTVATIDGCVFDGNFCTGSNDNNADGSHVYISGGDTSVLILTNSILKNGSAEDAGAVMVDSDIGQLLISNCLFTGNVSSDDVTLEARSAIDLKVVNNTFVNNTVNDQGIVRLTGSTVTLTSVIFSNNVFADNHALSGDSWVVNWRNLNNVDDLQNFALINAVSTISNNCFFDNEVTTPTMRVNIQGSKLDDALYTPQVFDETGRITDDPILQELSSKPTAASRAIIDKSDAAQATASDLDGTPADGVRDVGAYERIKAPLIGHDGGILFDLPDVKLLTDTASSATLSVWNAGDLDLTISASTIADLGFVLQSPTAFPIDLKPILDFPDATEDFVVVFDTTLLGNGSSAGDFFGTLNFDGNAPAALDLKVRVIEANPLAKVGSWMLYEN